MNASNLLIAGLAFVVLPWAGLSIWRDVALKRWHEIERNYVTYYASRQSETPGAVPPVQWDFEEDRLVEVPPEDYSVEEGKPSEPGQPSMSAVLVRKGHSSTPFWTWGIMLGQVSAPWFHGVFAGLTVLLGFLAAKWHA